MDRLFVVNSPSVVSEIIDGEVIIMSLKTGNYYSSDKVGAEVWSWIEDGRTEDEIHRVAASRYRASPQKIREDLSAFLDLLLQHGLVREAPNPAAHSSREEVPSPASGDEPFVTPELGVYTDMKDLLFLDPIHDVGEVGWPVSKDSDLR